MPTPEFQIQIAKQFLERSEVVAIPTETVYGLAANAYNAKAVAKIFQIKQRPTFDPLIVHTDSIEKIQHFVTEIPEEALVLGQKLWAGALTILLPKKNIIPDLVTAGLPRVAVRIPNHAITLQLLQSLDFPLAAPSANPFGYVSPTTAQHVAQQLGDKIPFIIDGGACKIGIESTIVGFESGELCIYRLGGIPIETIEELIGKVKIQIFSNANPTKPETAGMLLRHYATQTPLRVGNMQELLATYLKIYSPKQIGLLTFGETFAEVPQENHYNLSPNKDLAEAAQELFKAMRTLDQARYKIILATILPDKDLGRAINDRLRRAAQ